MNLKSRLNQLQTQAGNRFTSPAPSALHDRLVKFDNLRCRQTRNDLHTMSEAELAKRLHGELISDGLIIIKKRIPLTGTLGNIELSGLLQHPKFPGDNSMQIEQNIYIDTETTGLSGGSGTLAFLVGFAVLETSYINLSQFLITRFSSESPMLSKLANTIKHDGRLVSYNGKSYDLPLLISRYCMHSQDHPFHHLSHLDLLHPARRLFRNYWPNCRLTTLETRLLGFQRIDDLPGAEAPAAWFDYLREGWGEKLLRVVNHNQLDIISLIAAHTQLSRVIKHPDNSDVDLYGLARWLADVDAQTACQLLERNLSRLNTPAKRLLAQLLQRSGDWGRATSLWKDLAKNGCADSLERLAKYHEHVRKDLPTAIDYCLQLPDNPSRLHRLKRLRHKIASSY